METEVRRPVVSTYVYTSQTRLQGDPKSGPRGRTWVGPGESLDSPVWNQPGSIAYIHTRNVWLCVSVGETGICP